MLHTDEKMRGHLSAAVHQMGSRDLAVTLHGLVGMGANLRTKDVLLNYEWLLSSVSKMDAECIAMTIKA